MTKAQLLYELRHYPDDMEVFIGTIPVTRVTTTMMELVDKEGEAHAVEKVISIE